ncbi:hypothetical protein J8J40_31295, partial [Mycobacterium tuberculosis]|nr:hypothetical protein [Mycobacterium tuberculosis]
VAGASRGQESIFEGLRVIQEEDDDVQLAALPLPGAMPGIVLPFADQRAAAPRLKPAGGRGPRVEVASLGPETGAEPILRRKSLD